MPLSLLVAALAIAGGMAFMWLRMDTARGHVLGDLARLHATDVSVSPDWLDFDRDTFTFDVSYTSEEGVRHSNRCKVASSPLADGKVYWERALK